MTDISCRKTGYVYRIKATGHATGSSDVCAAISGILYALAGFLTISEDSVQVKAMNLNDADATIEWSGDGEAETAFLLCTIGLLQIAANYPDYCKAEVAQK